MSETNARTADQRREALEAELEVVALEEKFAELKATEDVDPDSFREAKDQLRAARQRFRAARDGLTVVEDEKGRPTAVGGPSTKEDPDGGASVAPAAVSAKAQEGGQR